MADITAELARVQSAYEQLTLRLLRKDSAPVVIAILRTLFPSGTASVPEALFHDQVNSLLGELRRFGVSDVPAGAGRDVVRRWLNEKWIDRGFDDDGHEAYALPSHTLDAISKVESLTRDRPASLSEHRIATIMNHLRRFNSEVNPDVGERVRLLNTEISRLVTERDRLLDGGEILDVTDDHLLEGYTEALQLLQGLPGEFTRVVEAFIRFRIDTIVRFNTEDVTSGEVVDAYLAHADNLATATPEGRAFAGAFALLRDDEQVARLREDIDALVTHPRASDILTHTDRVQLRSAVAMINDGLKRVLDQRTRAAAAIRDYISRHDVSRDRELANVLRNLDTQLRTWMQTAGPRAKLPVELLPGRLEITHLRERFYDPSDDIPPAPVFEHASGRDTLTRDELRALGGPSHAELADVFGARLSAGTDAVSLAEVFNTLPDDLRRPVEVLGILPLVHTHDMEHTGMTEVIETRRPDGTTRRLRIPQYVSLPETQASAVSNTHPDSSTAAEAGDETPTEPRQEQP